MKILVCGGRDYDNETKINKVLSKYYSSNLTIIHGGAKGADELAEMWALVRGMNQKIYPADWNKHGKAAGPIRNQQMLDDNPDIKLCIAFPGGRGTRDMINRARAKNITVIEVEDNNNVLDNMHFGEWGEE